MPTISWIGKKKVINHHHDVPFRVLTKAEQVRAPVGTPENTTDNRIIHGDNLGALKSLLPEFGGKVDCVYIDPPYNTGNEGWAYSDAVSDPKILKWIGEVVGKEGEDLSRHDKWLCMIYPRLVLLKKLLRNTGVLLVSIGDDELATLSLVLDEIFGKNCHLGTFVWKSRAKPVNIGDAKFRPQRVSEYVLAYGRKPDQAKFQAVLSGEDRAYPHRNEVGRKYRLQTILKSNRGENQRDTMRFTILGYTPPPTQRWQGGETFIQDLLNSDHLEFRDGTPFRRYFEDEEQAEHAPLYTFMDPEVTGTAETGKTLLNRILGNTHGFDTVKPLGVLERLLQACAPKDALILDSFAGSGSTAHAVLNLNARDNGNRRFILAELMDYAKELTAERVKRVIFGYGEGSNATPALGGGFDYYTVGDSLFTSEGELNASVDIETIRGYIAYTEGIPPECRTTQDNPYTPHLLGFSRDTAWVFNYAPDQSTCLNLEFLTTLNFGKEKPGSAIIYADRCLLSKDFLQKNNVVFKKIPRDVTKF